MYESENYDNLWNENDIKINTTVGKTNENENYYKRKTKTKNLGKAYSNTVPTWRDTHSKLASSSSTENSGVVPMISWLKANKHGHVNH